MVNFVIEKKMFVWIILFLCFRKFQLQQFQYLFSIHEQGRFYYRTQDCWFIKERCAVPFIIARNVNLHSIDMWVDVPVLYRPTDRPLTMNLLYNSQHHYILLLQGHWFNLKICFYYLSNLQIEKNTFSSILSNFIFIRNFLNVH